MSFETIRFSVVDNVARIVLDRPEVGNAVNMTMSTELLTAARACRDDNRIRAVLLSSGGPIFCAGGDLAYIESLGDEVAAGVKAMADIFHQAVMIFSSMDAPVVTAVHGMAAGGGVALALMSSIAVASEKARFVAAYSSVGLSPDGSLTFFLPRHVGLRVAEELILSNRTIEATEAQSLGMINEVVDHDTLFNHTLGIASRLASGPTRAYGAARRLLLQSMHSSIQEQLGHETDSVITMLETADSKQAIAAILRKQKPRFRG